MEGPSGSQGNAHVYDVEHLATFGLSEDLSIPADGMRRLLHMEKDGRGIWSQRMKIRLDPRYIVILDYENGDEMDRFPLHLIREPTAFMNHNPGELYNNVFSFIVNGIEMHIFQCYNISAADIVEDVKSAIGGRMPQQRFRGPNQNGLPPPPVNPPPDIPNNKMRVEDDINSSTIDEEDMDSGVEREVTTLNHCFEDIERFIARLQFAAAAYRELLRKRKSKKSKSKDHGEGLLDLRARPPHQREFIDILQKFKLCFNLLSRLRCIIHHPNAPELIHFLFTPLGLIVDASKDAHGPGLPNRVVAPLLTRGAIELLSNCLSSKETELWRSLGEPWFLTREEWKEHVPSYQPVFMDGWSPHTNKNYLGAEAAAEALRKKQKAVQQRLDRERSVSPVEMMGDDFNAGQRAFLDSVRLRGGRVVIVTHPRTANNRKELTVVRGEYLEVLDDSKKWWRARNWKGEVAHVPHTIVSPLSEYPQDYRGSENGRSDHWSPYASSVSSEENPVQVKYVEPSPPPPPPPTMEPKQNPHSHKIMGGDEDDMMQKELKNVLSYYRDKKRKIEISRTPEVFISQASNQAEIQDWLRAKGFSDRVLQQLSSLNGAQLFELQRAHLEQCYGKEEGGRLYSQITISKNTTGYKTARSSELRAVLEKARAKTEKENRQAFNDQFVSHSPPPTPDKPMHNASGMNSYNDNSHIKQHTSYHHKQYDNINNNHHHGRKYSFQSTNEASQMIDRSFAAVHLDSDSDSDNDNKGTLGRMLKQKRKEIIKN